MSGWQPRYLRFVLLPWRETGVKPRCAGGACLAMPSEFVAVEAEADAHLHELAFYVALYTAIMGDKPVCIVGGGGGGAANAGIARMGGEHLNVDVVHQPEFVRNFGRHRFILGDATDVDFMCDLARGPHVVSCLITLYCQLYSLANISAIRSGSTSGNYQQLIPASKSVSDGIRPLGIAVAVENTNGASAEMHGHFRNVATLRGQAFGCASTRQRFIGSDDPIDSQFLTRSSARLLTRRCCNGQHRRIPQLDVYGRPVRQACCRGNTVPLHGHHRPRLPVGLCAHCIGLEPYALDWERLTQAIPPAYASLIFAQHVQLWLVRWKRMPRVADVWDPRLRDWAMSEGLVDFDAMLDAHFAQDTKRYVRWPVGEHPAHLLAAVYPSLGLALGRCHCRPLRVVSLAAVAHLRWSVLPPPARAWCRQPS